MSDALSRESKVEDDRTYETLVIWSNFQDLPKFYLVPGDLRHLDGLIINWGDDWRPLLAATHGPNGDEPFKWDEYEEYIFQVRSPLWDFIIQCGEAC